MKKSPFRARFITLDLSSNFRYHLDIGPELGTFSLLMSSGTALERTMCRSARDLMSTLQNIADLLVDGGYWCGSCFDSSELWNRAVHAASSSSSLSKTYYHVASGTIRIEFRNMPNFLGQDQSNLSPRPDQLFSEWLPTAPTLGIEFTVVMEQKTEQLFAVHIPTLLEAAKSVGLKCLSFRNLNEFYETFKIREEELFKKHQVTNKHAPKLLPEQRDAASLFSVFVFQKSQ